MNQEEVGKTYFEDCEELKTTRQETEDYTEIGAHPPP